MAGKTVVVAGSIAQRPRSGGLTWVFLQYLLGFKGLGWDVLFLDRLEPDMCFDASGRRCRVEDSLNLRYLEEVMQRADVGDYALFYDEGRRCFGLPRADIRSEE